MTELDLPVITLDAVAELLVANGYEIVERDEEHHALRIKDLDSGVMLTTVLEAEVLFNSIPLATVPADQLGHDVMRELLSGTNGISTSAFQLYDTPGGVAVTLNNFAKLQRMGEDDQDDILSCLEFLVVDAWAAKDLLSGKLG